MESPSTDHTTNHSLEYIYDVYSPVLYGIAFQISSDENEAEKILVATFRKIHKLELSSQANPNLCLELIKLTLEIACELFPKYKRGFFGLKQFSKSPVLYQVIFENISISSLCTQYNLTAQQLMKSLRAELSLLSNAKKKYLVRVITIAA